MGMAVWPSAPAASSSPLRGVLARAVGLRAGFGSLGAVVVFAAGFGEREGSGLRLSFGMVYPRARGFFLVVVRGHARDRWSIPASAGLAQCAMIPCTLSEDRPRAFGACTATGVRWKAAARHRFTTWMLLMHSAGPFCCPDFAWLSADRPSVPVPARISFLLQSPCGDYRKMVRRW